MKIKFTGRGPLKIPDASQLELVDANDNPIDISNKKKISLCGCGATSNPPFCDGNHKELNNWAPVTH